MISGVKWLMQGNMRVDGEPKRGRLLSEREREAEELKRRKRERNFLKKQTQREESRIEKNYGFDDTAVVGRCGECGREQPDVYLAYVEEKLDTGARIRQQLYGSRYEFDGVVKPVCSGCVDKFERTGRRYRMLPGDDSGVVSRGQPMQKELVPRR